jgi:hypothetical protein
MKILKQYSAEDDDFESALAEGLSRARYNECITDWIDDDTGVFGGYTFYDEEAREVVRLDSEGCAIYWYTDEPEPPAKKERTWDEFIAEIREWDLQRGFTADSAEEDISMKGEQDEQEATEEAD